MSKDIDLESALKFAVAQVVRRLDTHAFDRNAWMQLHYDLGMLSGKLSHAWRNRGRYGSSPEWGVDWNEEYLRERVKLTFGAGFQTLSASHIVTSLVSIDQEDKAMTETSWHCDIIYEKTPFSCSYLPVNIDVEYSNGKKVSGIGLDVQFKGNRPKWLPRSYKVFTVTCLLVPAADGRKEQSPTVLNPA